MGEKILGFSIQSKGHNLYAVRRRGARILWIPLGRGIEDAERKILAYCEVRNIEINRKKAEPKPNLTDAVKSLESNLAMHVKFLEAEIKRLTERVRLLESGIGGQVKKSLGYF